MPHGDVLYTTNDVVVILKVSTLIISEIPKKIPIHEIWKLDDDDDDDDEVVCLGYDLSGGRNF